MKTGFKSFKVEFKSQGDLKKKKGEFQAVLKVEPSLFNTELYCGQVGFCWGLSLFAIIRVWTVLIVLLQGSSHLIPTTTCKVFPFYKA